MLLVRTAGLVVPLPWSALNVLTLLAAVAAVFAAAPARAARAFGGSGLASDAAGRRRRLSRRILTLSKQALIGEVYTLHLAIVAGVLALLFAGRLRAASRRVSPRSRDGAPSPDPALPRVASPTSPSPRSGAATGRAGPGARRA
jgi:hypothetical protein